MNADTSRLAHSRLDITAGQRAVLAFMEANTGPWTRHDIAEKARIPLQSVCGRVNELLQAGAISQLSQTRDGRHLLQLNAAGTSPIRRENAARDGLLRGSVPAAPVRVTYTVDRVTKTYAAKGDVWDIVDRARAHIFPDVTPNPKEPAFLRAREILNQAQKAKDTR